jgi:hypothetical protein
MAVVVAVGMVVVVAAGMDVVLWDATVWDVAAAALL